MERIFYPWIRNTRYDRLNLAPRDQPVSAELVERCQEHQQIDLRLHALAHASLDRMLARHYPDARELETRLRQFSAAR